MGPGPDAHATPALAQSAHPRLQDSTARTLHMDSRLRDSLALPETHRTLA